jgi:prepilin-type N-terminal cleavage/methylation domain-containing protein
MVRILLPSDSRRADGADLTNATGIVGQFSFLTGGFVKPPRSALSFGELTCRFGKFSPWARSRGYTIPEVLVSVAAFSVVAAGLFAGLGQAVRMLGDTRNTLRATQILQEQMETIRLYTWDQINSNGFVVLSPAPSPLPFTPRPHRGQAG